VLVVIVALPIGLGVIWLWGRVKAWKLSAEVWMGDNDLAKRVAQAMLKNLEEQGGFAGNHGIYVGEGSVDEAICVDGWIDFLELACVAISETMK
jgi:hypothetical protein